MKRITLYLVLILSLCAASHESSGQSNDSLGVIFVSADYPQCPDTAFLNQQSGNISVTIQNFDTAAFSGQLYVKFDASDSTLQLQRDSFFVNGGALVTILGGGTGIFSVSGSINFDTAHYRLGSNVVVVWPVVVNGNSKYNPYLTCVTVFGTLGLTDFYLQSSLTLSPTLVNNEIRLSVQIQKIAEDVRIYDTTGRIVYNEKMKDSTIPVEFLNPGMYILEIVTRNNQRLRKQFLKE